jgi:neutral ceramidase
MMMSMARRVALAGVLGLIGSCGGGGNGSVTDAGVEPPSTDHCAYASLAPTAGAGGTVEAGPLEVGVAEQIMDLPVGSALGGNTSRARAIGNQSRVDGRRVEMSGAFNPSIGVETVPYVRGVALSAGGETVVLLHTDTIFSDDTITHEVADRLGPDYAGKVLWTSSHSHTEPEQYSADSKLQVGGGVMRARNRDRLIEQLVEVAEAAIDARQPAAIGIAVDTGFDPDDRVSYDRRDVNDHLAGGDRKDDFLALIRIDTAAGDPLVIMPVLGNHTAILDDDVGLFSTDISGMYERLLEEHFADREVMAIHLQGAAGDVLPSGGGHLAIPDGQPQWDFARSEANARRALPAFLALWEQAGQSMQSEVAMEMVTRSVVLGPDWRTFTVRDGALRYAPFEEGRGADREIFGPDGEVLSPIDEFNAPYGAGLCGDLEDDTFQGMRMPDVEDLVPYHSCAMLPDVLLVLGALIDVRFEPAPLCASTRTTVSALRLGDYLLATAPGEPLVLWADHVRSVSPVPPEKTIILGYAQGHIGYLLTPEDWLQGGFEPSINLWGPLEGQYIAERLAELMELAMTPEREDAAAGGADRYAPPPIDDSEVPPPDPAPLAGTVPDSIPQDIYFRNHVRPEAAQPAATIARVTGTARFVWIGEDPLTATPRVELQRETDGTFQTVTRRSGRPVIDLDLLVIWTPLPLVREGEAPRTHYWTVEWQAVSWLGAPDLTELADRPGVPLGRYRFHIEGAGYTLDSDPFEVVPGPMTVTASINGDALAVTAGYDAPNGWRMLALEGLSNRYLPTSAGPLTVEVRYGSADPHIATDVTLTAPGTAAITPPSTTGITQVLVRDRFGNQGSAVP